MATDPEKQGALGNDLICGNSGSCRGSCRVSRGAITAAVGNKQKSLLPSSELSAVSLPSGEEKAPLSRLLEDYHNVKMCLWRDRIKEN